LRFPLSLRRILTLDSSLMPPLKAVLLLPLIALVFALTGCGSSSSVIQPMPKATAMGEAPAKYFAGEFSPGTTEIPSHIIAAIKGHLDATLQKNAIGAPADYTNRLRIDGTVTYYRMRSGFSRMMFGAMAGKDGVECDIALIDAAGQTVGKLKVESHNLMAVGSEDDVARMLAEETVKAIRGDGK
jgi:Domain of unknown function (DUF4410)